MALGLAEIVLLGLLVDWLFRKLRLPGLVGLLLLGVAIGPYALDSVNQATQWVSADWRLIALIVILLRAGFEMSKEALSKVGLRAALLSFIPCLFEVGAVTLVAPLLLPLSRLEAAMLGAVLAAVSPAVVVPLMIRMIEEGRGAAKGIPTLVLAGASVDDAVAIVLCTAFVGMYVGDSVNLGWQLARIPISVLVGAGVGLAVGFVLYRLFDRFNPRATKRVLVLLGLSVLLLQVQDIIASVVPFAALISIMAIGFIILEKREHAAHEISSKLEKVWVFAQLLLFAFVGMQVNVPVAVHAGASGLLVLLAGLGGRSLAVQLCLLRSPLSLRERLFVNISYFPKATVQAAIGATPLLAMQAAGMETAPGEVILAMAVISILITAPIGAVAIAWSGRRWLEVSASSPEESPAMQAAFESRGSDPR